MFRLCFNIKKTIEYSALLVVLRKFCSTVFFLIVQVCAYSYCECGHTCASTHLGRSSGVGVHLPHFLRQSLSYSSLCVLALRGLVGILYFCLLSSCSWAGMQLMGLCSVRLTCAFRALPVGTLYGKSVMKLTAGN